MVIITAEWKAKIGKENALKQQLETMVTQVKKHEPHCMQYTLHQGLENKSQFFFYERYDNMAAVETHKTTAHFKALLANTEALIAEPVKVSLLEVVQ